MRPYITPYITPHMTPMLQGLIPRECRLFLILLTKKHPSLNYEKIIRMVDDFGRSNGIPLPGISKEKLKLTGKGKYSHYFHFLMSLSKTIGCEQFNLLRYLPTIFKVYLEFNSIALKSLINLSLMVNISHHPCISTSSIMHYKVN